MRMKIEIEIPEEGLPLERMAAVMLDRMASEISRTDFAKTAGRRTENKDGSLYTSWELSE